MVLTTYADDESILDALRASAIGYITEDAGRDHIRRAIEAAAAGQAVLDRQCKHVSWHPHAPEPRPDRPTRRAHRLRG